MNRLHKRLRSILFVFVSLWSWSACAHSSLDSNLNLGVYAYREPEKTRQQFQPLVDFLNSQVSGFHIHLQVLSNEQLKTALHRHEVDLLLVNPSLYEIVRNENSLSGAIATVQRSRHGMTTSSLGGVVFTLANRKDISQYKDLQHKVIAVPSTSNMGAYRIPLFELKKRGLKTEAIRFLSVGTNDDVVKSVLTGKADVGFVRTGILEGLQDEGKLKLTQIKVIHPRKMKGFPYLVSTALYPEWPFVVLSNVDEHKIRQLVVALFKFKPDADYVKQFGMAGFVPPADYLPVQNLLRTLHLPPYDALPEFNLEGFWTVYHVPILLLLVLFIVVVIALLGTGALSANLKEQSNRLSAIIKATRSGSWEWDIPSDGLVINERWAEIIGYKLYELEPINIHTWARFAHPDDLKKSSELIRKHFAGELDYYEVELRMRHKDGRWIWVLDRGMVTRWSAKGEPVKMAGTHVEITNLKNHEELLKLNAARDEALLRLPQLMENSTEADFLSAALEQIREMVGSELAFAHIIIPGKKLEEAHWSECSYPVCKTHLDQQFSIVLTEVCHQIVETGQMYSKEGGTDLFLMQEDMTAQLINVHRCFVLPVFEQDKVIMLFGMGNKAAPYDESDIETVRILGSEVWRLIENNRIQIKANQQYLQYQRLVKEIGDNYVVFSVSADENTIQYASDSIEKVFGVSKEKILGSSWPNMVQWNEDSVQEVLGYKEAMRRGELDFKEYYMRFTHPSEHEERIIHVMLHAVRDEQGVLIGTDGLIEHVTDKIRAERELKQAASVFEYAQEGIMITDAKANILDVNEAFVRITGYERDEVIGQKPNILNSGRQSPAFYAELWKELFMGGQWSGEIWNRRKDGEEYPEKVTISSIFDEDGNVTQYIALFSDISLQKQQQAQLEHIAHYDSLTGLPNRSLLSDRISQAMAYSNRHQLQMAVVFIDLDGFKAVNDVYGHQVGDRLLVEIAKRFERSLRESDTIARLGGDEFVAVISDFKQQNELEAVLKRLLVDANDPVTLGSSKLGVSASIGVSFYRQGADLDADQVMRQADQAMYQAKLRGKNQIFIFEESDQIAQSADLLALEKAMERNELCLYYQPKVNMRTGEVLGFEALIRWEHPEKGLLLPGAFLTLLNDHPLTNKLGYWVIEEALKQMCIWAQAGKEISVSVNVEGSLLQDARFVSQLKKLLDKYPKVKPGWLTLEILESSAIEDLFTVSKIIVECRKLGVYFSIDDFGTGYASLTYLKSLPVHELKIDRSFIKDLTSDLQSLAIMQSLASMGQAFNLKVIAEGVENDQQAAMLLKLGYELAQGYRIARPMPSANVLDWLNAWQVFPHWQAVEKIKDAKGLVLVAVIAEHKAWVEMIKRYVETASKELPPLHPSECRFGRWLQGEGTAVLGMYRDEVENLHQSVHVVGEKAVALKKIGDIQSARKEMVELEKLKNQIVSIIEKLISERGEELLFQKENPS
ncbi:EAL domain-containing protein [Hydrogenovibrio sp. JE_KL2]|uniref:EAL domain-containing protein n=1 Tax=Hydrogenovibrio sp. JE_KL2 TaxID=2651188 RepID=UPI00128CC594|nr:EAL domain-containing protein [Hydrogenovibrio sp. JE_KL2]MPQ76623.1 EAL domain-containing protein [Hydrogenovibrio sp. JE_KL2]